MSKTILSVEDSPSIRQMVKITLRDAGYEVIEAADGGEGVRRAREGGFDMVLTDLHMPVLDGLSMVREMRALPSWKGVPIVFLSSEDSDAKKDEARNLGATAWIAKPFAKNQLVNLVRTVLG